MALRLYKALEARKTRNNVCETLCPQPLSLTMLEAASYNNFRDILMTSFLCPNLQRATTRKKNLFYFILTTLFTHYHLSADQV